MIERTFQRLHWGVEASHDVIDRVVSGLLRRGRPLRALSYRSHKGRHAEPETYRHEFDRIDGRGPYLLGPFDGEPVEVAAPNVAELAVLGRLIDLEHDDGSRAVIEGGPLVAVAGPLGRSATLVFVGVPYALEHRPQGPYVTAHGIEG